jgi:hypothetical protein
MSELLERMSARVASDMRRGIPFQVGMQHFMELIKESMIEIDKKIARIEAIERKLERKR